MTARFAVSYALRSLKRGGQRSVLAVVCIGFGVLALVAMQLLASSVTRATVVPAQLKVGGDLAIRPRGDTIVDALAVPRLVQQGVLTHATSLVLVPVSTLRSTRSGRVQFVGRAFGVDAAAYPLVGEMTLQDSVTLAQAVRQPHHVVLTRDMATSLGVVRGDTLRAGGGTQPTQRLVVGGIALTTPDRNGQTLYMSHETAALAQGDLPARPWYVARIEPAETAAAAAQLRAAGYEVEIAAEARPDRTSRVFGLMLRGAGILGLLVGGIGIAYTLHVMLTRRRLEIATLRTIGYRTPHLLALFGIEACVLGLLGGALGTVIAVAVSAELVRLLGNVGGALMLDHVIDLRYLAVGPVIGMLTAALFGAAAIVRASAVRPGVLLRDMPVRATHAATAAASGLHLLLALAFTAVATMIMGSPVAGGVVVALAVTGTIVLGGVLALLLRVLVMVPMPHLPLLNMARSNLRSQPARSAFALIALFLGVFAIGSAGSALLTGRARVAEKRGSDEGYNLRVYPGADDAAGVDGVLRARGAHDVIALHTLPVRTTTPEGRDVGMLRTANLLTADEASALVDVRGTWSGAADEALVPEAVSRAPFGLDIGDTLLVRADSMMRTITVAGFYRARDGDTFGGLQGMLLGSGARAWLGPTAVPASFLASFDAQTLERAADEIGNALPGSLLVSKRDLNEFLVATYRNLFIFVIAIAGLALVAGAVLIANAVSLAMVERRRELGILMAIGYTSRRVLHTILLENGALGLVAGLAGVFAVHVVIAIVNAREAAAELHLGALPSAVLVLVAMGLGVMAATLVAWGPVHVRPLEVLRDD